ncbi:hypothetical protein [Legionella sainthelensi]|uniref:hypothetical protein n=1 Tax=Legionella sainthelensi TaxID=28087 RepID=UPI0012DFE068|nr:hypothetical protein [Legionella sainthelensi]
MALPKNSLGSTCWDDKRCSMYSLPQALQASCASGGRPGAVVQHIQDVSIPHLF